MPLLSPQSTDFCCSADLHRLDLRNVAPRALYTADVLAAFGWLLRGKINPVTWNTYGISTRAAATLSMERLVVSEENPAPPSPQPVYRRATLAIVAAETRASRRLRTNTRTCVTHPKLILFVAGLHGIHVIMVYFYARTVAHPLPRGAINHTYRGLTAFTAFTYIVGYAVGLVDSVLIVNAFRRRAWYQRTRRMCCPWSLYWVFFWAIGLVVMLFFGMAGFGFSQVALIPAYKHACENAWITVLLAGHDYDHQTEPNRATFTLSATKEPLFTFTSQDPDRWQFNLASLGSARPSVLPALRNITFDDPNLAVSGLCYGDNGTTTACMTGRYDPVAFLSFDVTANGARARSRSPYREWTMVSVLSVILRRVEDDGSLSPARVLQTSPPKPVDCKQLKVCIAHPPAPTSVLAADILVAVGWLLGVQGEAAVACTTPRGNPTVF